MPLVDYHDVEELKNRNEEKVWVAIEKHLGENASLCRCRDCILDAAAIALNSLPPRYSVYSFHEKSGQAEAEAAVLEAEAAVGKAFGQVTKKPHHL